MSNIVLTAAVRQNLLSLQNTASLMATTQNDLATGNKVNSALDNPTNFFTASGLNNRASDISNLLDGISNGVQVLQAANTGLTSIESLVSQAQSIANQALQTQIGYSTKANIVSTNITNAAGQPASASNLLGVGTASQAAAAGSAVTTGGTPPLTSNATLGSLGITSASTLTVGTTTFSFTNTAGATTGTNLDLSTATLGNLEAAIHAAQSTYTASDASNALTITTSGTLNIAGTGTALTALGLTAASTGTTQTGSAQAGTAGTAIGSSGAALLTSLTSPITVNDTITVNGSTITFNKGQGTTTTATGISIDLATETVSQLLSTINGYSGGSSSINSSTGAITLNSSYSSALTISGGTGTLAKLGLGTGGTYTPTGYTLAFGAVGNGTATTVTFGTGANDVQTLTQLNNALAGDNLEATINSSTGALTISTTNDAASATIPTPTGSAVTSGGAFYNQPIATPVADPTSQATRATLVSQYNAILTQITNTATDASYNGVNLLDGDQLELTFNETGTSKVNITGVQDSAAGLGLSNLTAVNFADNNATNTVLSTLNDVSTSLRSQASAFGSNLSVVQTRQDFNKSLINVLQTGAANLTQADINEEAANSQALSTRQSLSISALSLANQAQQSVLQLLR